MVDRLEKIRDASIVIDLHQTVQTAVEPSDYVCQIATMFGLGVDQAKVVEIVPPTALTLWAGQLVFITGASGGGKTTLLRLIRSALASSPTVEVIDYQAAPIFDDRPLVDLFDHSLEEAVRWLSLAGLNDAFVMVRSAKTLSEGQQYRLRLAWMMAQVERSSAEWVVVLADEFGATLDRLTAKILAKNVRKWSRRSQVCFIAATTHDDLLSALAPDTLIVQYPGTDMAVVERAGNKEILEPSSQSGQQDQSQALEMAKHVAPSESGDLNGSSASGEGAWNE